MKTITATGINHKDLRELYWLYGVQADTCKRTSQQLRNCRSLPSIVMTELSPAAQAVLDAALPVYDDENLYVAPMEKHAGMIAAALRAAADQVVPPALEEEYNDRNQALPLKKMVEIRRKLNAIADELEAQ